VSVEDHLLVTGLPPTPRQSWLAVAGATILLVGFGGLAPFAAEPLARLNGFIPAIDATISVTDLITAIMLLALLSISFSPALLILACGYLFSSIIVVAHALTFPGGFSPSENYGGIQTPLRLYILWHLGSSVAMLGYKLLDDRKRTTLPKPLRMSLICQSIAVVFVSAFGLVWLCTAGAIFLPSLQVDPNHFSPVLFWVVPSVIFICTTPLAALWIRRRSLLDEWLMVVVLASLIELALTALLGNAPFSVGFYTGRIFSIVTSTAILAILLVETAKLYSRLAVANMMLERERDNKLMSLEAVLGSVDHELRQPLGAIAASCDAAILWLTKTPPELAKLRASLDRIAFDGNRSTEVIGSLRALFRRTDQAPSLVDMHEVIVNVLDAARGELTKERITCCLDLATKIPFVSGNVNQLRQLMLNLIYNAVEAMAATDCVRELMITTDARRRDKIIIGVEDSGPGIDQSRTNALFEAFYTTKPHGMGLGLAICKMIVERHGGQMSVSAGTKGGAKFQIELLPIPSNMVKAQ
jgi:signal transduction histidine kinase